MAQKLYVGNLPFTATEDDLRALFGQHGQVISVQIIMDRDTGRPRGFAFVEVEDGQAAIQALDGQPFGGRNLKVNLAKEREQGGGGGGGRPRGGQRW
jgi:RNA recognition motif-containing protein